MIHKIMCCTHFIQSSLYLAMISDRAFTPFIVMDPPTFLWLLNGCLILHRLSSANSNSLESLDDVDGKLDLLNTQMIKIYL